jgi:hypothetical protein
MCFLVPRDMMYDVWCILLQVLSTVMSFSNAFPESIAAGVALDFRGLSEQDPDQESLDPTNAFSTSYIDRQIEELNQNHAIVCRDDGSEKTNSFPAGYVESRIDASTHPDSTQAHQDRPITSLQSAQLHCRLLIRPSNVDDFDYKISGAKWATLPPHSDNGPLDDNPPAGTRCLVVHETAEAPSCALPSPIPCELFFDP